MMLNLPLSNDDFQEMEIDLNVEPEAHHIYNALSISSNKKRKRSPSKSHNKKRKVENSFTGSKQFFKIDGCSISIFNAIMYCSMQNNGAQIKYNCNSKSMVLEITNFDRLVCEVANLRIIPGERIRSDVHNCIKLWFNDVPASNNFNSTIVTLKPDKYEKAVKNLLALANI